MNQTRSRLTSLVVVLLIVAGGWSTRGVNSAEAIIIIGGFGMFGLTRGETARTYAYALKNGDENGVIAIIRYFDTAGNVVAESGEMRLAPGQSAHLDLSGDNLNFGGALRAPVRVEVSIGDPNTKKFRKPGAISSVEIFESSSGKTISIIGLPYIEQKN